MKTDFDFTQAGKKMPYTVPDGFFEDAERLARKAARKTAKPAHGFRHLYLKPALAAAGIAALAAGMWLLPANRAEQDLTNNEDFLSYDYLLQNADTEELEYIALAYADVFDDEFFDF